MPPPLTIVIPTYNESGTISPTIGALLSLSSAPSPPRILVVDGGSFDATRAEASAAGARVLTVAGGRAAQLNAGADAAGAGDTLLFLHADTLPPQGYDVQVEDVLRAPRAMAGAWRISIEGTGWQLRVVERWVNFRSTVLGMPYGDQGLFMRKAAFVDVGGYKDMPLMEDYEMSRRLRKFGGIRIARGTVKTSGRRWETLGVFQTTIINQCVVFGYHAGVPVKKLAEWYRGTLRRAEGRRSARDRRRANI